MDIQNYNKIILVGSGGSGKSWMAKRLAASLEYPLYHLDKELWQADWVMTTKEEKIAKQQVMISGEQWIIDGNYNSTLEIRFAAADLIIFLDISRVVCLISVIKRTREKHSDIPEFLEEHKIFDKEFIEFCKWIWSYPKTGRKTVMELHEKYSDKAFLHIQSRREVKKLIKNFKIH